MPVDCCYDNFQSVIIYRLRFHRDYYDSYPAFCDLGRDMGCILSKIASGNC